MLFNRIYFKQSTSFIECQVTSRGLQKIFISSEIEQSVFIADIRTSYCADMTDQMCCTLQQMLENIIFIDQSVLKLHVLNLPCILQKRLQDLLDMLMDLDMSRCSINLEIKLSGQTHHLLR